MSQDEIDDLIATFDGKHDIGEITAAFVEHGLIHPETDADRRDKARRILGRIRKRKIREGRVEQCLVGFKEKQEDGTIADVYIQPQYMTRLQAIDHIKQLHKKLAVHQERMYEFARYYVQVFGEAIQKRFPFAMPEIAD